MTDSRAALDMDRLPWLTDERTPPPRRERRKIGWATLIPWSLVAVLLVAGVSYWLGMRSMSEPEILAESPQPGPAATAVLPEPAAGPVERVQPAPMPEVKPIAEPAPVRIGPVKAVRKPVAEPARRVESKPKSGKAAETSEKSDGKSETKPTKLEYWPAIESTGASGRMVRIGTFSSRRQAKKGWWAIVRHYPGMRNLKAVVAPVPSLRNGKTYYRLQFGTTSQAHSAILCQRMRMIAQSCVVVGLSQGQAAPAK